MSRTERKQPKTKHIETHNMDTTINLQIKPSLRPQHCKHKHGTGSTQAWQKQNIATTLHKSYESWDNHMTSYRNEMKSWETIERT